MLTELVQEAIKTKLRPLHQSDINSLRACPRFYALGCRMNLRRRMEVRSPALDIGTLTHALIEGAYRHLALAKKWEPDTAWKAALEIGDGARQNISNALEQLDVSNIDFDVVKAQRSLEQNWAMAKMLTKLWFEEHPPSGVDSVAAIELDVPECGYGGIGDGETKGVLTFGGRVDLIIGNKKDGYWIPDHKTTSNDPADEIKGKMFHPQTLIYPLLAEAAGFNPCHGVVYNFLRKPTIKYCNKDTNFDAYIERCKKWYADNDIQPFRSFAVRKPTNKPVISIEFEEEFSHYMMLAELVPLYDALICNEGPVPHLDGWLYSYPRHRNSCKLYQRNCPFRGLCEVTSCKDWDLEWFEIREKKS